MTTEKELPCSADHGLTLREVALRYRVARDKVLGWIRTGELQAINTATRMGRRPRYLILDEALRQFENRRTVLPAVGPRRRYRQKPEGLVEYIK